MNEVKIPTDRNHSKFWDQKCKKDGQTGWSNQIIYRYDQPLRLRVIKNLMNKIQGSVKNKKILDIGCGVGDFSIMFAKMGAHITGIDISKKAIEKAKKKVHKRTFFINFLITSIEDMNFPMQSFDIITSFTVLQHISDKKLSLSVRKMVNSLKFGGYIYLLETAPISLNQNMINLEYQYFRTRNEWVELFEKTGAKLHFEIMYPNFGLYLIRKYKNVTKKLYYKTMFRGSQEKDIVTKNLSFVAESDRLFKVHSLVEKIILSFSKPFDYYMPSFSARFGNITRIMVFKRLK